MRMPLSYIFTLSLYVKVLALLFSNLIKNSNTSERRDGLKRFSLGGKFKVMLTFTVKVSQLASMITGNMRS